MLKPHGYSVITDPGAKQLKTEADLATCIHCRHIDFTKNAETGKFEVMIYRPDGSFYFREAGRCRSCDDYICPRCAPCERGSLHSLRRIEAEEKAARKFVCF